MKYMVFSDVHGSLETFSKLMKIAKEEKIDNFLFLGDILYHGPRNFIPKGYGPKELAEEMNKMHLNLTAVKGNCDAEVDQMVLDYDISNPDRIVFINDMKVAMSHGHIHNEVNLPDGDYDIFLSGHTHIPSLKRVDKLILMNPGSLTLPKQNNPKTFAVMDELGAEIRELDTNKVLKSLKYNL